MHLIFKFTRSSSILCSICFLPIAPNILSLSDQYEGDYYHVKCFKPYKCEPLKVSGLETVRAYDKAHSTNLHDELEMLVEKWMKRVCVRHEDIPPQYLQKSVSTNRPTTHYRLLISVFSYLSGTELDRYVAFVSKQWFHITREDDLWRDICTQHYQFLANKSNFSYRMAYILANLSSCWNCNTIVSMRSIAMKCPIHNRPICVKCADRKECKMMNVDLPIFDKLIDPSLVQKLRFSTFQFNTEELVYVSDFCKKIVPYAQKRRKLLLNLIKTSKAVLPVGVIECIRNINFQTYYGAIRTYRKPYRDAVISFCGKNDEEENLKQSFNEFLERLRQN